MEKGRKSRKWKGKEERREGGGSFEAQTHCHRGYRSAEAKGLRSFRFPCYGKWSVLEADKQLHKDKYSQRAPRDILSALCPHE